MLRTMSSAVCRPPRASAGPAVGVAGDRGAGSSRSPGTAVAPSAPGCGLAHRSIVADG